QRSHATTFRATAARLRNPNSCARRFKPIMSPAVLERLRGLLLGGPKNLLDPRIHHNLALIAFFAWVGLGSDGLSSSCYGPEAAYLQLAGHAHLALYLGVATVATADRKSVV